MAESDPAIHQRGDGAAAVGFAFGPRGTTLARLYQRAPCRVLFPAGPGDPEAVVVPIAAGGRFLGCEGVVLGRRARGERFTHGLLHEAWRIRRDGRLVWADALRLDGDVAAAIAAPSGFAGAEALATAIYVGADAADHLALARAIAEDERLRGGASLVNGVLLARLLGSATAVRAVLVRLLTALRGALGGPAAMPRVWQV